MEFVKSVCAYKYNLKYEMHVLLIRLKLKGSFNSQVNVLKKNKIFTREFRDNVFKRK